MSPFANAMEIFKLLDKSNCKKCNKATCLAFAGAVFQGEKRLDECPHLDEDILEKYRDHSPGRNQQEVEQDNALEEMKSQISAVDLSSLPAKLGGNFSEGKLTIKCLGKDFSVDSEGQISTDIHVHPWIAGPVLDYILKGGGSPVSGQWVPFRELEGGKTWYRLFGQRCEKPLKKVADTYTALFEDMIQLFNGKEVEKHYQSDISLVLHPLPRIPILICYWKPDDGLESDLNLFFDATAEEYLHIESIYTLGAGLVMMFEKIAVRHGI
jgi:hypothetical protein